MGGGGDSGGRSNAASGEPPHEFVRTLDQESQRWLATELERVLQLAVLAVLQLAQDGVRSLEPPPTIADAVSKGTW